MDKDIIQALGEFYQHYDKENVPDQKTLEGIAQKYAGNEREMWTKLYGNYDPEFSPSEEQWTHLTAYENPFVKKKEVTGQEPGVPSETPSEPTEFFPEGEPKKEVAPKRSLEKYVQEVDPVFVAIQFYEGAGDDRTAIELRNALQDDPEGVGKLRSQLERIRSTPTEAIPTEKSNEWKRLSAKQAIMDYVVAERGGWDQSWEDLARDEADFAQRNPVEHQKILRREKNDYYGDIGYTPERADERLIKNSIKHVFEEGSPRQREAELIVEEESLARRRDAATTQAKKDALYEKFMAVRKERFDLQAEREAGLDQQIEQLENELAEGYQGMGSKFGEAVTRTKMQQLAELKAQKRGFFDPTAQAKQVYTQMKDEIDQAGEAQDPPREKFRKYYAELVWEKQKLFDRIQRASGSETGDLLRELSGLTIRGWNDDEIRYKQVSDKLKALAPIVFFNESIKTKRVPMGIEGKEAIQGETPGEAFDRAFLDWMGGGGGIGAAGVATSSPQQQAQAIYEAMAVAGIPQTALNPSEVSGLDKKSQEYGLSDPQFWTELSGTSLALLTQMGAGGAATKPAKIGKGIQAVGTNLLKGKGKRVVNLFADAIESGASYEAAGTIFDNSSDELNFASGMFGGAAGSMGRGLVKGGSKTINNLFGNKAPEAMNKIMERGASLLGRGAGETAEEFTQELVQTWQSSDTGEQFWKSMGQKFGDFDDVEKFVISTFVMGMAMGAGHEGSAGSELLGEAQRQFETLDPQQQERTQQVFDLVEEDLQEVRNDVREAARNDGIAPGTEPITEEVVEVAPEPVVEEETVPTEQPAVTEEILAEEPTIIPEDPSVESDKPYTSKSGKYVVERSPEGLVIKTIDGKKPSESTTRRIKQEYEDSFDYLKGSPGEVKTETFDPDVYEAEIIESTTRPMDLIDIYENRIKTGEQVSRLASKENIIAENIGKVDRQSFIAASDKKQVGNQVARSYLKKGAIPIDTFAKELSEEYGQEISVEEIVQFIINNPSGTDQYYRSINQDRITTLAKRKFKELTGLDLNERVAHKAREKAIRQSGIEIENYYGKTESEIEAQFNEWAKGKEFDEAGSIKDPVQELAKTEEGLPKALKPDLRQEIVESFEKPETIEQSTFDQGKEQFGRGLDTMMDVFGLREKITGEERPKVTEALTDMAQGLMKMGQGTFEDAWNTIKEKFTQAGGDPTQIEELKSDVEQNIERYARESREGLEERGPEERIQAGEQEVEEVRLRGTPEPGVEAIEGEEIEPAPKEEIVPEEKAPDGRKLRGLAERILKSPKISEEVKQGLSEDAKYYVPKKMSITDAEADAILAVKGIEASTSMVTNKKTAMTADVRVKLASKIADFHKANAEAALEKGDENTWRRETDAQIDIDEFTMEFGTELGRGVNAFKSFQNLGPRQFSRKYQRQVYSQKKKTRERSATERKTVEDTIRQGNEAAARETAKRASEKVEKATKKKAGAFGKSREEIKKGKQEAIQKWKDAIKRGPGAGMFGGKLIEDALDAAVEYGYFLVAEGVASFKDWSAKMKRDLPGIDDEAIDQVWKTKAQDGKTLEEAFLSQQIAERIYARSKEKKTPKDDPVKYLMKALDEQIREKRKPVKKSPIEILKEAIQNKEQYADVWESAREEVIRKIEEENISPDEKVAKINRFSELMTEAIEKPFTKKQIEAATREAIRKEKIDLEDLVVNHFTEASERGKSLAKKLVEELGVSEEVAPTIAKEIEGEFSRLASEKKKQLIKRRLPRAMKLWGKVLNATNDGTPGENKMREILDSVYDLPEASAEVMTEIEQMAEEALKLPEGNLRNAKIADILAFMEKQKGMNISDVAFSLWYANILSGPSTHLTNIIANLQNTVVEGIVSGVEQAVRNKDPLALANSYKGVLQGWVQGAAAFKETMRTGKAPKGEKYLEIPNALERINFAGGKFNPLNYAKFVGRALAAADMFFYHGLKEMRYRELFRQVAIDEGLRGKALKARVDELMYHTKEAREDATLQAQQEAEQFGLNKTEETLRRQEIIEEKYPEDFREKADHFASFGTFNYDPKGLLGAISRGISTITETEVKGYKPGKMVKLVIPFTRVVANVLNQQLDYSPYGFTRLFPWGRRWFELETSEARNRQIVKASIGTLGMATVALLSAMDEDEEEPRFRIHGRGPTDYAKKGQLYSAGWKPLSIQIGDSYISFQTTPMAVPFSIIGNYMDAIRYGDMDSNGAMMHLAFAMKQSGSSVFENSFLSGLGGLIEALGTKDPDRDTEKFLKTISRYTGGTIPNAVKQVYGYYDPTLYRTDDIPAYFVRDLGVAGWALKPRLDVYGRPIERTGAGPVGKFFQRANQDPVYRLANKRLWVKVAGKTTKLNGERMTDDQYWEYVERSGKKIYDRINARLGEINSLEKEQAQKIINEITDKSRKEAKTEMGHKPKKKKSKTRRRGRRR